MKLRKLVAGFLVASLISTTMAFASTSINANADTIPTSYKASLQGQLGEAEYLVDKGTASYIDVKTDGNYSISLNYSGEDTEITKDNLYLILGLDFNLHNIKSSDDTMLSDSGIKMSISSVTVDGNSINYHGSPTENAFRVSDDNTTIRFNIYNTWSANQQTEDVDVPFSVKNGSILTVNFNISGLDSAIAKAQELNGDVTTVNTDNSQITTTSSTSSDTTSTTTIANSTDGSSSNSKEEQTATPTNDTGISGVILAFALASATMVGMRKKH